MMLALTVGQKAAAILIGPALAGFVILAIWLRVRAVRERKRLNRMASDVAHPVAETGTPRTDAVRARYPNGAAMAYDIAERLERELSALDSRRSESGAGRANFTRKEGTDK